MMDQFVDIPGAGDITEVFTGASGRRSTPSEQAWPMIFLNSDEASYVSGTNLATDAGTVGLLTTGRKAINYDAAAGA